MNKTETIYFTFLSVGLVLTIYLVAALEPGFLIIAIVGYTYLAVESYEYIQRRRFKKQFKTEMQKLINQ